MSSEKDNADVIAEKWLSVGNHIHNKHKKHGKYYKNCNHGRIRRKWFKNGTVKLTLLTLLLIIFLGTKSSKKVLSIINNKSLQKAVTNMSPSYQTSSLEAFHSVVIHFAPEHTSFSHDGMLARFIIL